LSRREAEARHLTVDVAAALVDNLLIRRNGAGWVAEGHLRGAFLIPRVKAGVGRWIGVGGNFQFSQRGLGALALRRETQALFRLPWRWRRSNSCVLNGQRV